MDNGPIFVDTTTNIVPMLDNVSPPGAPFNLNFNFKRHHSTDAGILVDPSLTAISPFTNSAAESQFLTPSSTSILSPRSSVDYFGDHRGSFSACSDTVAPHETMNGNDFMFTKEAAPPSLSPQAIKDASRRPFKILNRRLRPLQLKGQRGKRLPVLPAIPDPVVAQPSKRKSGGRQSAKKSESQRSKNLERNRIAASKCRQKKKEWVQELEETKSGMEQRHTSLRLEYLQLLDEVTRIKNHLMAHAVCNDPNINFWIEKEALKFVARCNDPSHMKRPSIASTGEPFLLGYELFEESSY
ncbi:Transcription factor atf21 [Cladobotryum mycophilum]|uniref:Transcription factor atf21 n=1 Tax=Cladobotryum mycophilum TaxID=491253 RepID=A0ABR0SPB5_9HYPO